MGRREANGVGTQIRHFLFRALQYLVKNVVYKPLSLSLSVYICVCVLGYTCKKTQMLTYMYLPLAKKLNYILLRACFDPPSPEINVGVRRGRSLF